MLLVDSCCLSLSAGFNVPLANVVMSAAHTFGWCTCPAFVVVAYLRVVVLSFYCVFYVCVCMCARVQGAISSDFLWSIAPATDLIVPELQRMTATAIAHAMVCCRCCYRRYEEYGIMCSERFAIRVLVLRMLMCVCVCLSVGHSVAVAAASQT